jgi:hypothetical protein
VPPFYRRGPAPLEVTSGDVIKLRWPGPTHRAAAGGRLAGDQVRRRPRHRAAGPAARARGARAAAGGSSRVGGADQAVEISFTSPAGAYSGTASPGPRRLAQGFPYAAASRDAHPRQRGAHGEDPRRLRPQLGHDAHLGLPHAAGQHDRGAAAADPGALRLLRADQLHHLPAGDGPAVLPEPPGRGPQAHRGEQGEAGARLPAPDRLPVQGQGLRVVRPGPQPRGAHRSGVMEFTDRRR